MITLEEIAILARGKRLIVDVVDNDGTTQCTVYVEKRTVGGTLVSNCMDTVLKEISSREVLAICATEYFESPTIHIAVLSNRTGRNGDGDNG